MATTEGGPTDQWGRATSERAKREERSRQIGDDVERSWEVKLEAVGVCRMKKPKKRECEKSCEGRAEDGDTNASVGWVMGIGKPWPK